MFGICKKQQDADTSIENYLNVSRSYLVSTRKRGRIIVIDSKSLSSLLNFLSDDCNFDINVTCTGTVAMAKRIIQTAAENTIKAVIADFKALPTKGKDCFLQWMGTNHSSIPIFINLNGVRPKNMNNIFGVGIFVEGETPADEYVAALGLPPECTKHIAEFAAM